ADHLEVLYDIDIEAQAVARSVGVHIERARSLNTDPVFIAGLADIAGAALATPVPGAAPAPRAAPALTADPATAAARRAAPTPIA
ncbi:MAG TPA: ferrochelatase, partial [Candidatus Limnocylindrales bacterium]